MPGSSLFWHQVPQMYSDEHIFQWWLLIGENIGIMAVKFRRTLKKCLQRSSCATGCKRGSHWMNTLFIFKFKVDMQCTSVFEINTMLAGAAYSVRNPHSRGISSMSSDLIWPTPAMYIFAAHAGCFEFCHSMFY